MRMRWIVQNDAKDAEGFLVEGEPSFVSEMELLRRCGCPDTATAQFVGDEVVGRCESVISADVSVAMAEWLQGELDAEEIEVE